MEARLFYSRPVLINGEIGDPRLLCHNMFVFYYHEYYEYLRDIKAKCANWMTFAEERGLGIYSSHLLTVSAVNFAMNNLAEWANKNGLSIDRFPVTLDNITWLLISIDITKSLTKEFAFKTILPLLMDTITPAYEIVAVNDAIRANEAASNMDGMDDIIHAIFREFPDKIAELKSGKTNMVNFFIGETIKRTKNKSPELRARVTELISTV